MARWVLVQAESHLASADPKFSKLRLHYMGMSKCKVSDKGRTGIKAQSVFG